MSTGHGKWPILGRGYKVYSPLPFIVLTCNIFRGNAVIAGNSILPWAKEIKTAGISEHYFYLTSLEFTGLIIFKQDKLELSNLSRRE